MMTRMGLVWLVVLLLASACQPPAQLDAPPDIRYGEDACDQCRMIISEARFAAAYVTGQGEVRRFDDIGDMLLFLAEQGEEVTALWVHDYETEEWLKADKAYFVVGEELVTPMGYGIVAVADQERAERLAGAKHGMVLTFETLRERFAAGEIMPGHAQEHQMQMAD